MKNSVLIVLGVFLFLPIKQTVFGQDDIATAARNADIAARDAADAAQVAAESAEKAVKMAVEAAEAAGIEIEELDTFETNPTPVIQTFDDFTRTPFVKDQIPVSLNNDVAEPEVEATPLVEVGEPVQPYVYQDSFAMSEPVERQIASAKAVVEYPDTSLEFHGYFRAGYLIDTNNNSDKLRYRETADRTDSLGTIGLRVDDWWYATLAKKFETKNGGWGKTVLTYGSTNSGFVASDFVRVAGNSARATAILEAYMQLGILEDCDASVWFGQRHYGRDLYSQITDFYYTDYSGTGVGIENLSVGCGKLDIAYLNSDFSREGWIGRFSHNDESSIAFQNGVFETDELLHSLHIGYDIGNLRVGLLGKYYPANRTSINRTNGYTDVGVEGSVAYSQPSFYGIADGCSTYVVQVGSGLSSGPGLGTSFNAHNIFRLGAQPLDFITRQSDDVSYRASTYGCLTLCDWLKVSPHILVQVDTGSMERTLASGVLRGEIPLTDCFSIITESAVEHVDMNDGMANDGVQYKVSVAPTMTFQTGYGESAAVSLIAAHIDGDVQRGYQESQTVLGVQAAVNW